MTLIISYASSGGTIQVSDSLVTFEGRDPGDKDFVFNKIFNKCAIYVATNGCISLGFSGAAYIDRVPTDQWIAQSICGAKFPIEGWVQMHGLFAPVDLGQSIRRLKDAINGTRAKVFVSYVGWQWKSKKMPIGNLTLRLRPLWGYIGRQEPGSLHHSELPRYWHFSAKERVEVIPQAHKAHIDAALGARITSSDFNTAINLMIQEVRKRSKQDPTVGEDCVAVYLRPPEGRIDYIPVKPIHAVLTPWILGFGVAFTPSVLLGGGISTYAVGPMQIQTVLRGQIGGLAYSASRKNQPSPPKGL